MTWLDLLRKLQDIQANHPEVIKKTANIIQGESVYNLDLYKSARGRYYISIAFIEPEETEAVSILSIEE